MDQRADVLIVGSGAAGGALTWRLTERGIKVVCLEQGGWINPLDFPSSKPNYEIQLVRGDFHFDPNTRKRREDYPILKAGGNPPNIEMFNAVGGTTIHWQGHFPRFHPSDFKMKTLDGIGDDWPISYHDLEPYYDLNDRMIGVSGISGDPANPPRSPRQTPPLPIGKLGNTIANAFEKLNWHWWVSDQAIISQPYANRPACLLHGKCMFGCPIASKASTDRTYWPLSISKGAELKTWSRVKEITVDKKGNAEGALYFDKENRLQKIKAKVTVVCCNGIGTPRVLLNSRSNLFPEGLGNSNGILGKYFMLHPGLIASGTFEEEMDGHIGPMGSPLMSQEFYETDLTRGFYRGYSMIAERNFGPVSHSLSIPWGKGHHMAFKKVFPHQAAIGVYIDDLPEPNNRIELSNEQTDSNGIPAAKAFYTHGDNSKKIIEHAKLKVVEALETAGAKQISFFYGNGAHLMGTARMGNDPNKSVINANHQVHEVSNLFIVDGSSFVTASAVNPTSTIMALALRAADKIWELRRNWN